MSDLEPVEFKIYLNSLYYNDPPKFEVLLNNEVIEYGEVIEHQDSDQQRIISFTRDLEEGNHTISVRLLGKKPRHTQQDENGNIIEDQLLNLMEVEIDEIELGNLFYDSGRYYKQTSVVKGQPVYATEPEPLKYSNFGWNGEWRLDFSVPTYMWFLENL
jgi:hypothetical protein